MMRLPFAILIGALCTLSSAFAHVGTQSVFYEGQAGPYQLRVFIQPPPVVPGRAQVHVRIHNGPVHTVDVLPVRWDAGRKGAPPPDRAVPVEGEPGLFTTELWVMDFGAYSVFVDIDGPLGKGTAIVPFNSISSRRLEMPRWLGLVFLVTGGLLALLLVVIVGAASRESVLVPGAQANPISRRRSRIGMSIAAVLVFLLLGRGNAWWKKVDEHFQKTRLSKTLQVPATVERRDGAYFLVLDLTPTGENWRDNSPLVADHGKLMHMFLIAKDRLDCFAHMHPRRLGENRFETRLPHFPPGSYRVFADINHETGLTQTLIAEVTLPEMNQREAFLDPDDSTWAAPSPAGIGSEAQHSVPLGNGAVLRATGPLKFGTGREAVLRFEADGPDGKALPLEAYLGMWSHAAIQAEDGSVFSHLHPSGTISLASQELFARRERGESLRKPLDVVCGRPEREIAFPYSFPHAGKYRMWVQIKSGGQVLTGAYDLQVVNEGS